VRSSADVIGRGSVPALTPSTYAQISSHTKSASGHRRGRAIERVSISIPPTRPRGPRALRTPDRGNGDVP